MKKILFVGYGGGHITMLIPIIHFLRKHSQYHLIVLGLTTAAEKLRAEKITYFGYKNLVDLKIDREALKIGQELFKSLGKKAQVDVEESVAYLGLSYFDLVSRLGALKAKSEFELKGRQSFLQLSILERVFKRYKPDLVIATNSPRSEKAAILTARKMGIPSICLVDFFDPREFEDRISKPGYANRVCVLSESVKNKLMESGRKEREIIVTGNPAFDNLIEQDLKLKSESFRSEFALQNKKVLLWARQANPNDFNLYEQIESCLFHLIDKNPNWTLIIRPHPNDSTSFSKLPKRVYLSPAKNDLATILHVSDVIVTVNSTVGLQGVSIGKPLITVELGFASPYTPYGEMGISIGIKDIKKIEESILKAFEGFKPSATFPKPGNATKEVVKVIKELLDD